MFEALKELVAALWDDIKPCYILNQYEGSILLRGGKYHRTDKPGLNWKIPFYDDLMYANIVVTTIQPGSQSLLTKDNKRVVVSTVVKYQITDVKPYLLGIEDQDDVLVDVTLGAVRSVVCSTNLINLNKSETEIKTKVRQQVKKYGFKIHDVTFIDVCPMESFRLIHDGIVIGE